MTGVIEQCGVGTYQPIHDLVTIDVGWTPQRLILPAARRSLKPSGRVLTLIKPQYEAPREWLEAGVVPPERLPAVLDACRRAVHGLDWQIEHELESPLRGHGGNVEYMWLLRANDQVIR